MKIRTFTFMFSAMFALSLSAQTTYYIDAEKGDDANPGTKELPWATFNGNSETWRTVDCTIYLADGAYDLVSKIPLEANIEIIGSGIDKVFIQQFNDEDFEGDRYGNKPYMSAGFFDVTGSKTVKMSNLTMKNLRVGEAENSETPYWGGAITVQPGSTLELNTVDFNRCILPVGGGAGIDCKGSLNLTNVRFIECEADRQGAAISLAGDAKGQFEGCSFIRNVGTTTIQVYPQEVVGGTCADLRFNNCFFDSNDYSDVQYGAGIHIGNFYGQKLIFHVSNTTFVNNRGNSAGCMFITTNIQKEREIDMKVENCVFMRNVMTVGAQGSVYSMNSGKATTLTGSVTFANNTFYHNDRADDFEGTKAVSDIFLNDQNIDLNLINNIILVSKGLGYGIVFSVPGENTKMNFKNNIFETVGGTPNNQIDEFKATGIKVGQSEDNEVDPPLEYRDGNEDVKLDLNLVSQGDYKAPYLRLQEGSVAIDAGYNDGGTLVPVLDIRGAEVYNEKKDVGAYEYGKEDGSGLNMEVSKTLSVSFDRNGETLFFNEVVANVKAFTTGGTMIEQYSDVESLNIGGWENGVYILVVTDMNENVSTFKILK